MLPPDANRPSPRTRPVTQASFDEGPLVVPVPAPLPVEAPAGLPPGLAAAPTVTGLLAALRRRLLLALALATAGMALAIAGVCVLVPARFVVQTQVKLFSRPNDPIMFEAYKSSEEPTIWKANQEGILKSPVVLDQALRANRAKGLATPYGAATLETALKTDFLRGPEIMRVTLMGDDGEALAALLNGIVDAYLEQVRQEELGRRKVISKELETIQSEYGDKLRKAEADLRKEEQRNQYDPERAKVEFQLALDRLKDADKDLQLAKHELAKKERELRSVEARANNPSAEPLAQEDLNKELAGQPAVQEQLKELADLDQQIAQVKATFREELHAARLKAPVAAKAQAQERLDKLIEQFRPGAEERLRAKIQEGLKAQAGRLKVEVEGLKHQRDTATNYRKTVHDDTKRLDPGNRARTPLMDKLRSDVAQINDALTNVNKQIAKLRVEPVAASRAQILQRATAPQDRDHSRQIKFGGAAGLGVFGLLLFGVAMCEFRARKVNSADEVSQGLGLKVLGTLPALPPRLRRPVPGNARAKDLQLQNQMTEAVDAIRTLLLHQTRADGPRVVMVTSPGGGEGKTSLASQLAASLARAWRKTLLVDGDLRNPAAHKLFDAPLEPGLSEVLRGESKVCDVVRPTQLSRLWMVPAGSWDSHAVQALAQDGVRSMFAQLKGEYEFIIVDSCPVLPVADALLLAQHVDAVVFSILRDVSRLPAVHAAHQRLSALGVRTLGAVVIGASNDVPSMAYQYPRQNG